MERLKACCYVRTSTSKDQQEDSFRLQKEYFTTLILSDPALEFAGCYGDYGKSGRNAEDRPEFQRMLKDCELGKIQVIYTKSISRFARNIADLVEIVNRLRNKGVTVYFEKENLNTADRTTELLLNILGIMAAEESRSFSENVRLGLETRTSTGHPVGKIPYGYRKSTENGNWIINRSEASRIQMAFRLAGSGKNYQYIIATLNQLEEENGNDYLWKQERLHRCLTNVVYKGDVLTGKSYRIGQKVKSNHGEIPQYYLEDHHEPIVTSDLFDHTQDLIKSGLLHSGKVIFTEKEKRLLDDSSWIPGQTELENRHGGYQYE